MWPRKPQRIACIIHSTWKRLFDDVVQAKFMSSPNPNNSLLIDQFLVNRDDQLHIISTFLHFFCLGQNNRRYQLKAEVGTLSLDIICEDGWKTISSVLLLPRLLPRVSRITFRSSDHIGYDHVRCKSYTLGAGFALTLHFHTKFSIVAHVCSTLSFQYEYTIGRVPAQVTLP